MSGRFNTVLILPLTVLLALAPTNSWGQRVYTFKSCVSSAKLNNAEIQTAEQNLNSSQFSTESIKGSYYPQLAATLSYSKSGPESLLGNSASQDTYAANLSANQNVFNGFSDSAKVSQALAQTKVAQANLLSVKAKVSYDLKSAYASLLYAKEIEKATLSFRKRREDNYRMVDLRFQSGRENKGSLLLSKAYLKQSEAEVLKANHLRRNSASELIKTMGLESDRVIDNNNNHNSEGDKDIRLDTDIEIIDDMPLSEPSATEPDFKQIASSIPDHLQAVAQVGVSEASVNLAKAGYLPTLNLSGTLGKTDNQFFPNQDRWSVGANLSWALFGGGKDYYSIRSSAASLSANQKKLTSVDRQLLVTLRKAYNSYVEAVEDFKVNEAFLQAAKSRAEIAQNKYNNGLMTFDEWDIIENDLIAKTKIYIQSKRDRMILEAAWEQATGAGVLQ